MKEPNLEDWFGEIKKNVEDGKENGKKKVSSRHGGNERVGAL